MAGSANNSGIGCGFVIVAILTLGFAAAGEPIGAAVMIAVMVGIALLARNKSKVSPATPEVVNPAERIQRLQDELEFFRDYENQFDEVAPSGFVFKRDEHVIAMVSGAALMESRRGPSEFRGGTLGLSFRATNRISVRQAAIRGRAIPGEETPTVIDEGSFVVTNQRGIFVGQKQSREFAWAKLLGYQVVEYTPEACVLYLPMSGREKVAGIGSDGKAMRELEQRVTFAIALVTGRRDDFIRRIEDELRSLQSGGTGATDPGSLPPPVV